MSVLFPRDVLPHMMFSNASFKTLSCIKEIKSSPKENWASFRVKDFSNLTGQLIAIDSISLKCNDVNVCSPFIVNWNGKELVYKEVELCDSLPVPGSTSTISKCHGCTLSGWDRNKYITPILQNNIQHFFASDMQTAYMNFKSYIQQHKSLTEGCKDCAVQVYFADPIAKTGPIECITFPTTQFQQKKRSKDALFHFIEEILDCDSLRLLFKHITEPYMRRLERYGIDMVTKEGTENIFPPLKFHKEYDSDFSNEENDDDDDDESDVAEWSFILPLDAVKKMLLFFQTLENENNIYFIPENDRNPLTCYIHVPRVETPLTYVLDIHLLLGKVSNKEEEEEGGLSDLDQRTNDLSSLTTDPMVLASTYKISIDKDDDSVRKKLEKIKGIESVRTDNKLIFFD